MEAQNVILQIEEVAQKTGGMEWLVRAKRLDFELALRKQSLSGETLPNSSLQQSGVGQCE